MACPECDESGEYFLGPPKAEIYHFGRRSLWALHRLRQALEAQGKDLLAALVSSAISAVDEVATRAVDCGNPKIHD